MILNYQRKYPDTGEVVNCHFLTPVREDVSNEELEAFLADYKTLFIRDFEITKIWLTKD